MGGAVHAQFQDVILVVRNQVMQLFGSYVKTTVSDHSDPINPQIAIYVFMYMYALKNMM